MRSKFDTKIDELLGEKRAVSPVIGVILMVAIVVILAAVIGFFVLGLGGEQSSAPQASFTFSNDGGDVTITHDGGDTIDSTQLTIQTSGTVATPFSGQVSAGSSAEVTGAADSTIRVVHQSDNGQTSTLATYDVPA